SYRDPGGVLPEAGSPDDHPRRGESGLPPDPRPRPPGCGGRDPGQPELPSVLPVPGPSPEHELPRLPTGRSAAIVRVSNPRVRPRVRPRPREADLGDLRPPGGPRGVRRGRGPSIQSIGP